MALKATHNFTPGGKLTITAVVSAATAKAAAYSVIKREGVVNDEWHLKYVLDAGTAEVILHVRDDDTDEWSPLSKTVIKATVDEVYGQAQALPALGGTSECAVEVAAITGGSTLKVIHRGVDRVQD